MRLRAALAGALLLSIGGLLALAAGEITVRAYAGLSDNELARQIQAWDPLATKIFPHGDLGYRQKAGAVFPYPGGRSARANSLGWRGPEVATPKPAGTTRVVLLGESTTHGWGVDDDETIDSYLRRGLLTRLPGRVEVVNLAFDGYDAWQILQRLISDGLRLEPDLLILNTGINDVRNARYDGLVERDPRTLIWEGDLRRLRAEQARGAPSLRSRIKHWSYLARLPGVLRQRFRVRKSGAFVPGLRAYPDAARMFERNVQRIVDTATSRAIPIVLMTPPSILLHPEAPADMSPRDYWLSDRAATQAYRDTLAARLAGISREAGAGRGVWYLAPQLPPSDFLDDCHLTPEGNRRIAAVLDSAAVAILARLRP